MTSDGKCPKCGGDTQCLGGRSAHPSNWYCVDESGCGWEAWKSNKQDIRVVFKPLPQDEADAVSPFLPPYN